MMMMMTDTVCFAFWRKIFVVKGKTIFRGGATGTEHREYWRQTMNRLKGTQHCSYGFEAQWQEKIILQMIVKLD